jgi:putative DNA-binding protein
MPLDELQRVFVEELFGPRGEGSTVARLRTVAGRSPSEQFSVYQGSVMGCILRGLQDTFPVCVRVVGQRFFDAAAELFVRREPSRSADLNDYGATFPAFLEGFPPAAAVPYLADLARLEWACQSAALAAEDEGLDFEALAQVPEARQPDVVFELSRSSTLLRSAYPLHRIWQISQPGVEDAGRVSLAEGGVRLLVRREGVELRIEPLGEDEMRLLGEIGRGRPIGEIGVLLGSESPPVEVPAMLPRLVQRGWITGFHLAGDPV